jgi:hypothetical protein
MRAVGTVVAALIAAAFVLWLANFLLPAAWHFYLLNR